MGRENPSRPAMKQNILSSSPTIFISIIFQGNPGVAVHLTGQQRGRGRGHGRPQTALLHLPVGALCQLPALLQRGDRSAVVGTLWCGVKFRRAAAYRHGAVMSGAGGDGQVRWEEHEVVSSI